uniref:Uncharacterized protein n=1 Tax=Anguilla anguilla TaxID=7936 RepID=A0A0E9TSP8_ANGAN
MTNSQPTCKWGLILLYLPIPPHCPRLYYGSYLYIEHETLELYYSY